jgi:hypothetical protein
VSTNVHPKDKKQSRDNTLKYAKKGANNVGNVEDVMFKVLFGGDLKLKVAENVNKSSKSNSIGVYFTEPFCNSKTRKSRWVVVYGDNGNAWMLKSESESVATYQMYCLVIDKALLTLITATLIRTFTFAKINSALKVYRGADPAPQDKKIGPSPGFHLSIPMTQRMKTLVNKAYLKQLKSSSCQWKSMI